MMIAEFIERVGFEPTADEYEEIEQEYMGCDVDKDQFCKDWKKNGGIQRLSRQRVRKIEELESKLALLNHNYDSMYAECSERYEAMKKTMDAKLAKSADEQKTLAEKNVDLLCKLTKVKVELKKTQEKLEKIRDAFAILTGKEDE